MDPALSPELVATHELFLPVIDPEITARPDMSLAKRVLERVIGKAVKLGRPFFVATVLLTACSDGEEGMEAHPDESVPVLTTTITTPPTTVLETTTAPTTELATTTSLATTETTEVQVNINNKALCEQARDPSAVLPGSGYDQAGVPNLDEMIFHGDCTGLPGDLDYGWVFPGGSGYVIPPLDTTGFVYNSRGFHFSELPPVGSANVPWDWDAEHPKYQQYDPVDLSGLVLMERGTTLCSYLGTNKRYSESFTLGRVGLVTYDNKYDSAGPDTYVGVFLQNPDGTEDPVPWAAESMGVMEYSFGGWSYLWVAEGECKDLTATA